MTGFRISPANRLVLSTVSGTAARLSLLRAFKREMEGLGSRRDNKMRASDIVRLTFMIGFVRSPVFYLLGTAVALASYLFLAGYLIWRAISFVT